MNRQDAEVAEDISHKEAQEAQEGIGLNQGQRRKEERLTRRCEPHWRHGDAEELATKRHKRRC
jgi:hypothetical protein